MTTLTVDSMLQAHRTAPASDRFERVPNGFGGTTTRRKPEGRSFQHPVQVRPATSGQISYLRDLVARKTPDMSEEFVQAVIDAGFDRVSKALDTLRAKPDVATDTPARRINRYAGQCGNCSKPVEAGAGTVEKVDGAWVVWHNEGDCFVVGSFPFPDGYYALDHGDNEISFYHCIEGQVLAVAGPDEWPQRQEAATRIVAEIAQDPRAASVLYGRKIERCGICHRRLSKKDSREAGIGPVCAGKAGW